MTNLNINNFQEEVINSSVPVLIDFYAPWCGPCKMLSPIVEQIHDQYKDKIKVFKVNVDENMQLASLFQISSVPTLISFDKGKVKATNIGFCSKEKIEAMLF